MRSAFHSLEIVGIARGTARRRLDAPNGRAIAFARTSGGGGAGVYIANADGTGKAVKVYAGSTTGVDWGPAPKD